MTKSGLYINGNKVCDIHKYSTIKIIPQSYYLNQGNTMINNFKNVSFHNSKIVVDDKEFNIKEYSNNQENIQIEIFGSIQELKSVSGNLTINAESIGVIKNTNGNLQIQADTVGSASTVNGNIYHNKI